jgi:DNA-binding IclR family transcriptional regulator
MRYILENIDSRNMIIATYEELIKATKASRPTVAAVLRYLKKVDFLRERTPSVYMVSPRFLVQGGAQKRQNLMVKYAHLPYSEAEAKVRKQQIEMFEQENPALH